ncbi:MAG: NAD-dependent epimerase/dehydratase family protein [Verrucomicrobia bacterium]|nr:NAD-dependent epimerase/dehydratase family protein [Verrucomicrobiota bacterium]NDF17115.1 NAD-dependent epimerase/dehydratase family protein [Verrucomicrobiota bacterium]
MKFLVTGGAGFIGSHLVRRLSARGPVTVLDNLASGNTGNLAGLACSFFQQSILQPAALAQACEGVTHVFHLAAMVSVPESMARPGECHQINVEGTRLVLEAASQAGAQSVVLASSCAVYGNEPGLPKTESSPTAPASPYAESKLKAEKLCARSSVPAVALRFFNVYGPRQDPRSPYAAAVPKFLEAARAGTPITIFGEGHQTRDFVHVDDVAAALEHVALSAAMTGTYNVAFGRSVSVLRLAELILALTGLRSEIRHAPARPGDILHSSASIEKIRATGWAPSLDLANGLQKTLAGS